MHPITRSLLPIAPPIKPQDQITIVCAASVPKAELGERSHGFALAFVTSSDRVIPTIAFRSDSSESDNQRGELAAVLTAYEWLDVNNIRDRPVTIYSSPNYVHEHLIPRRKRWLEAGNKPNLDIIQKIDLKIDSMGNVSIKSISEAPEFSGVKDAALLAARKAASRKRLAEVPAEVPEEEWLWDDDPETDALMRRAMDRDR